jgi:sulfatase maturation enzyme AslB (radical SAM superfamily)
MNALRDMRHLLTTLRPKQLPRRMVIETSNRCNANCTYCGAERSPVTDMPIELFKAIVDASPFAKRIDPFRRGEPLCYPDIIEAIEHITSNNKESVLYTNGSLLDADMAKALIAAGIRTIWFSVDEYEKEAFEKIRRGLDFDEVLYNIEQFQKYKNETAAPVTTGARICITDQNRGRIEEIKGFWKGRVDTVKAIYENPVFPKEIFENIPKMNTRPIRCYEIYRTMVIRPDGVVNACCPDWYDTLEIGRIDRDSDTQDILDIFNGEKMTALRRTLLKGRDCPIACALCRDGGRA